MPPSEVHSRNAAISTWKTAPRCKSPTTQPRSVSSTFARTTTATDFGAFRSNAPWPTSTSRDPSSSTSSIPRSTSCSGAARGAHGYRPIRTNTQSSSSKRSTRSSTSFPRLRRDGPRGLIDRRDRAGFEGGRASLDLHDLDARFLVPLRLPRLQRIPQHRAIVDHPDHRRDPLRRQRLRLVARIVLPHVHVDAVLQAVLLDRRAN